MSSNYNGEDLVTVRRIGWLVAIVVVALCVCVVAGRGSGVNSDNSSLDRTESTSRQDEVGYTGEKEVTEVESIPYTTETVQDPSMEEGVNLTKQAGVNGEKKIYYSVEYKNGVEVNRTYLREEIIRNPVNEIKAVGTHHTYMGYCSIEGYYRRRYVSCVGDYSPQAKANAEAKAAECNASSYAVQGCYNVYR